MESSWAGFGVWCVLQVVLSPGKRQHYGIQHHLNTDPRHSGGGFGCCAELCSPSWGCGQHRDVGMSQSFRSICGCTAFCL